MSLTDTLEGNLDSIAAKVGMTPDQVKSIITTLQSKLTSGGDQPSAIDATARQYGVPVDKIQQILSAAGGSSLFEKVKGFGKGLFGSTNTP